MSHIVIIGNGIAGITTARFIRKMSDHKITVISSETDHFFSRTALMYIYMGHMKYENTKPYEDWFWAKNRIELLRDQVERIDPTQKQLQLKKNKTLPYDKLVLATGSQSNKFGWPGQDLKGVQGLYSYQDLELMEANTKNIKQAIVIGGGLIGVEMAEMLHSRHIPVTYLIREKAFSNHFLPQQEAEMVSRHVEHHGIQLLRETELQEVLDDGTGHMRGILTKQGQEIEAQFLGLTVGVHPNIDLAKDTDIEVDRGWLVNQYLQTSNPHIYAVGDCSQLRDPLPGRRAIEPIWYTGRMQGKTAAHHICGQNVAYDPGIWFNSAKFFDIEYQVYGDIDPKAGEDTGSVYWEHPQGEKSIRVNYKKDTSQVIGFNLMGIRYRHEVCEKWIKEGASIQTVMQHLGAANFDPEFFKQHEQDVVAVYNHMHPDKAITLKTKRGLFSSFFN